MTAINSAGFRPSPAKTAVGVQSWMAMAEARPNTEDSLRRQIGEPGSPVRRIREKDLRVDVVRWLNEQPNAWPPEIRLRAYLAIGRAPEPALLSDPILLRRALSADDCASFAGLLTTRRTLLDAAVVFSTLAALVRADGEMRVERLAGRLERFVARWSAKKDRIPLDFDSVRAYIDVVLALLEKAGRSQGRTPAKRDAVLLRLVALALTEAAEVKIPAVQQHAFNLLAAARNVIDAELSTALEEQRDLRSAYDSIVSQAIEDVRRMAMAGSKEEFANSAHTLRRLKFTERQARQLLENLYSDRGKLEPGVQSVLADLLEVGHELQPEPDFETGTVATVQSTQLASALLRSWTAAGDSPRAGEAFDELCSVLQNFFGIQVKGEPGEIAEFNSIVHELTEHDDKRPARVRLIRPRVEVTDGRVTTVLIKALVEPA